jgi:hypothetical protein
MNTRHSIAAAAAALLLAVAPPLLAREPGALQLVPGDAVAVGYVNLSELRSSPLSGRIFEETDRASVDGDAGKFMREAGLEPTKDVDVAVFALRPDVAGGEVLVTFEGRFDPDRLTAAVVSRGGERVDAPAGVFYRLPSQSDKERGAVAFPSRRLAIVGTEAAVTAALNAYGRGGSGFATATLGREMRRFDTESSAWVLIDVPRMTKLAGHEEHANPQQRKAPEMLAALKRVDIAAFWTKDTGDSLHLGALVLSADSETRGLVEDAARGLLAGWRLAAQDKSPELIPVLRQFKVTQTADGVTLSGTLPAATIESLKKNGKLK